MPHFKSDFPIFYFKHFLYIVVNQLGYYISNSKSEHKSALVEKYLNVELNEVKDAKGRGYHQAQHFSDLKNDNQGTSLVVQRPRLCAPNIEGWGSIPGHGTSS